MNKLSSYQKLKNRISELEKEVESSEYDVYRLIRHPEREDTILMKITNEVVYTIVDKRHEDVWMGEGQENCGNFEGIGDIIAT